MIQIPKDLSTFIREAGDMSRFTWRFFREGFRSRFWIGVYQTVLCSGLQESSIGRLTAFIIGLVLTMQLRPSMVKYGVRSPDPCDGWNFYCKRNRADSDGADFCRQKWFKALVQNWVRWMLRNRFDAMEVSGTNPLNILWWRGRWRQPLCCLCWYWLQTPSPYLDPILAKLMYEPLNLNLFYTRFWKPDLHWFCPGIYQDIFSLVLPLES